MVMIEMKAMLRKSCITREACRRASPAVMELSVASELKKEEVP